MKPLYRTPAHSLDDMEKPTKKFTYAHNLLGELCREGWVVDIEIVEEMGTQLWQVRTGLLPPARALTLEGALDQMRASINCEL